MTAQPIVVKLQHTKRPAHAPERMDIDVTRTRPTIELNAELDRALRLAQKFVLINTEHAQQ